MWIPSIPHENLSVNEASLNPPLISFTPFPSLSLYYISLSLTLGLGVPSWDN